jgi:ABC-type branched-subunit amino acid transport system permease subunit
MKPPLAKMGWAMGVVLLAAVPTLFGPYYTNVFVTFAIFSVFTVSLNLLLGYTGLFSFGHAMFFGAGGYGTALALKHVSGLPLLPAVGAGVLRRSFSPSCSARSWSASAERPSRCCTSPSPRSCTCWRSS